MAGATPSPDGRTQRQAPPGPAPFLSVVIPVRNEAPNIVPLVGEIAAALQGVRYEIIYVDDGSTDATCGELARAAALHPLTLRALRHGESCGQSAAIVTGVAAARGSWIATLDGDGQNDPADIPALLARAEAAQAANKERPVLIAGNRVERRDSARKRLASRVANRTRMAVLRDATPDTGCGLKIFGRESFQDLPKFDHMHRYLPALFLRLGGDVISVPVNHRPRVRGQSNYGTLDRLWVGLFDMAGVAWLQRRWKRPAAITRVEPLL